MATKCQECKDPYNPTTKAPMYCNGCSKSVCLQCLNQSRRNEPTIRCPLCRVETQTPWVKNQNLLRIIEASNGSAKCELHKRRVLSLCCSPQCQLSPGICELVECSKIHKSRGVSNVPLSFFNQTQTGTNDSLRPIIINDLFSQVHDSISDTLSTLKHKLLLDSDVVHNREGLGGQSQKLLDKVNKHQFMGVQSVYLARLKKEMEALEQRQEVEIMNKYQLIVEKQKQNIIPVLIKALEKVKVNLFQIIVLGKDPQDLKMKHKLDPFNLKTSKLQSASIQATFQTALTKTNDSIAKTNDSIAKSSDSMKTKEQLKQLYQQAIKLCYNPKVHAEYDLLRQAIGRDFSIALLYSSSRDQPVQFKQKVAGQHNLFVRVQLLDGKILGSFFKKAYPESFYPEKFHVDPDAFVYWLNKFEVFRAAKNSKSQYDVSPHYLFSCGSTFNWDGFWFRKDFKEINPEAQQGGDQIKSTQYVELRIPIPERRVLRFEAYNLQFK